ncbi:SDR family oxidoreductase [Kiloniella sp.]|uniref:SDR family oxidoreductase n=1 Tax=Kiloniella sp. TaxID=1938587 RepID=UPI003A947D2B
MTTKQKTAIVTGAGKGIGAEIALQLAADGYSIIVNYIHDQLTAQKTITNIIENKGKAIAIQGDVSDTQMMIKLFDAAEENFSQVTTLINNAGVMRNSTIEEASDSDFDLHSQVNFGSTFRGMREAAKRLSDKGRIINISSSVVGLYQPSYGLYAASKAAIEAMTPVLAKELAPKGITVNTVSPGPIETDFLTAGKSDELIQKIIQSIPLGRLGTPNDIAAIVSFLAGPDSGWITGQTIRANGGAI